MLGYHKFYFDITLKDDTSARVEFAEQNYYHNQLVTFYKLCNGEIPAHHYHSQLKDRTAFMQKYRT
jgi:hypothetical protein